MIQSVNALAMHGWLLASDVISKLLNHDVGPQRDDEGCLGIGIPTSGTQKVNKLHVHTQAGADHQTLTPVPKQLSSLPSCVQQEGGFFESDAWKFVLALCAAGAAVTFVMAILIGVKKMLGGQGMGIGQAVKAVLPLLLFAAMFSMIATLPTLVLPGIGKIIELIFGALNSMMPGG